MFRPVKIRNYIAIMQAKGFSAEAVLKGSGIDPDSLNDQKCLVDFRQSQTVVSNMISLTGDQGIGFEMGASAKLTDLGIIGHALISAPSLGDAIKLWTAYGNSLLGVLSKVSLDEDEADHWAISISELAPSGFIYNFCVEELLMMTMRLGAVLADEPMIPVRLELSYPAPAHQELYYRHFRCPIQFNSPRTKVAFSSPHLRHERSGNDHDFNEICLRHCSQLARQIESRGPVVSRLRDLLLRSPGGIPSLEEAARELGMSPRSMRRHLMDEGTNYKTLIGEFRLDLAREYLRNSHMSLAPKEVAYLLGFKDTNAFRRAFKSWTGKTVGEYCAEVQHA
ncbi:MAG: AraC family transcriptional regulator [Sinimarinibacterium sp.]|jgi:AraC-like DNA-binding protein